MVKITDKYYMDADYKCYTLKEKGIVQDEASENFGKERFKDIAYCQTIEQIIDRVLTLNTRELIMNGTAKDLKDLKKEIHAQTEYLKSLKLDA